MHYAYLAANWTWDEVLHEAQQCQASKDWIAAAAALTSWSLGVRPDDLARANQVMQALATLKRMVTRHVSAWIKETLLLTTPPLGARWLYARLTVDGLIKLDVPQFIASLKAIMESVTTSDGPLVWPLVLQATLVVPHEAELYVLQAHYAMQLGQFLDAANAWSNLLRQVDENAVSPIPWAAQAHTALATLYATEGPIPDAALQSEHQRASIRYTTDVREATEFYLTFVRNASWNEVETEARALMATPMANRLVPILLHAWLSRKQNSAVEEVVSFLEVNKQSLSEWAVSDGEAICALLPQEQLRLHPVLAASLMPVVYKPAVLLALAEVVLKTSESVDETTVERIAVAAGRAGSAGTEVLRLLLGHPHLRFITYTALKQLNGLNSWRAISAWLSQFRIELESEDPVERLALLVKGLELLPRDQSREQAVQQLIEYSKALLISDATSQETHRVWHAQCGASANLIKPYLNLCSFVRGGDAYANALLDRFISNGKIQELADLTEPLCYTVWQSASVMARILLRFTAAMHMRPSRRVDPEMLSHLSYLFDPERNVDRADMLAASIAVLRKRTPLTYLTILARELEALVLGGHFAEARERAAPYEELRLGRQRLSVEEYINFCKPAVEERSTPISSTYKDIATALLG